jgi:hypothetical protein
VNSVFDGYGEASQPGQNDTRSATNASSLGDFGPYYPGGYGLSDEDGKGSQPEGAHQHRR